ncbi:hypothetical protein HNY42_13600 [Exiguobacterium sp. Helios]|uniref:hypothetical protein n=1 Tax=Exiguobacterium sp. Helios TaxID=2735868 RepID=UPI00165D4780|nr:hypothetical protein [Exiguobacterium sp. Helios]QNR21934.1 hypothetical protein HNY42_13600 [Exiguobacterium sp. Helios]
MRFVKPMTIIVLISSCLLSGCMSETEEPVVKPPADVKSVKPVKEKNEVEEFLIKEPSKDADTPGKAAVEQIQLTFKNGQTAVPTEDDVLSEAILGQKAVVSLHAPKAQNNYIILFYERSNRWTLTGILPVAGPSKSERSKSRGLKLPFQTFKKNEMVWNDEKDASTTWTFTGKQSIITVSKLSQQTIDDKRSASVTLSNGITAYTHETRREASLSYQDGEQTVLLGGNVPLASLKILAESLPSVNSGLFPYAETE